MKMAFMKVFFLICEFMLIHADSNQFVCQTRSQFFPSSTTKSVAKITSIIIVLINRVSAPAKLLLAGIANYKIFYVVSFSYWQDLS